MDRNISYKLLYVIICYKSVSHPIRGMITLCLKKTDKKLVFRDFKDFVDHQLVVTPL